MEKEKKKKKARYSQPETFCILSFSLKQIIKAELLSKSLEMGVYSENTDRSITIAMQIEQIKICINDNVI